MEAPPRCMVPRSESSCWLLSAEVDYRRQPPVDWSEQRPGSVWLPHVDGMVRPTPLIREKFGTVGKAPDDEGGTSFLENGSLYLQHPQRPKGESLRSWDLAVAGSSLCWNLATASRAQRAEWDSKSRCKSLAVLSLKGAVHWDARERPGFKETKPRFSYWTIVQTGLMPQTWQTSYLIWGINYSGRVSSKVEIWSGTQILGLKTGLASGKVVGGAENLAPYYDTAHPPQWIINTQYSLSEHKFYLASVLRILRHQLPIDGRVPQICLVWLNKYLILSIHLFHPWAVPA